jgi:hypothetical protein
MTCEATTLTSSCTAGILRNCFPFTATAVYTERSGGHAYVYEDQDFTYSMIKCIWWYFMTKLRALLFIWRQCYLIFRESLSFLQRTFRIVWSSSKFCSKCPPPQDREIGYFWILGRMDLHGYDAVNATAKGGASHRNKYDT